MRRLSDRVNLPCFAPLTSRTGLSVSAMRRYESFSITVRAPVDLLMRQNSFSPSKSWSGLLELGKRTGWVRLGGAVGKRGEALPPESI